MKHTPGPWQSYHEVVNDFHGKAICDIVSRDEMTREAAIERTNANSRLIAATPDLLEALKGMRQYNIDSGISYPSYVDLAIAKAEGK